MKAEYFRIIKNVCASGLVLLVLSGADCGSVIDTCPPDPGPNDAYNTISSTVVTLADNQTSQDNTSTYSMTILDPDPYIRWNNDGTLEFGYQSLRCFGAAWQDMHGSEEVEAFIWAGSDEGRCGRVANLQVTSLAGISIVNATVTVKGTLGSAYAGPAAIVLNKSCLPVGDCAGKKGLTTQCFEPFAAITNPIVPVSVPGADLNFITMDGVDLRDADFKGVSLTHASATGANLRDANFNGAVIIDVDFTGADMHNISWGSARLLQVTAPDGTIVHSSEALEVHLVE